MDALQFAYWLHGFSELHAEPPSAEQWQSIREHLDTVFVKVTPPVGLPQPLKDWTPQTPIGQDWWNRQPTSGDPIPLRAHWLAGGAAAQSYC